MSSATASTASAMTVPVPPRRRRLPAWATGVFVAAGAVALLATTSALTGQPALTAAGTMQTALRLAVPILLAGLGGLWSERAGVVNIGLEGMMILGTWGAAWTGYQWGPWAALGGAAVFGALGGLLHAVATVSFGVNHIVSGVAINLLGAGAAMYLSTLLFLPISRNPRQSPPVPKFDTYSAQPLTDWLGSLENTGQAGVSSVAGMLRGLLSGLSPLTILALALVPVSYFVLWHTRFGLRLRSCGENPIAAASLGVSVYQHKYLAVVLSGAFAGLGGAALLLNPGQPGYLEGQTGGRGYIGLAAMIFGNWRPAGLLGGAALFGYADGLQLRSGGHALMGLLYGAVILLVVIAAVQLVRRRWLAAVGAVAGGGVLYGIYWSTDELPSQIASYAPHLVTLMVLAVASQRLRPPAADGMVYRKGDSD